MRRVERENRISRAPTKAKILFSAKTASKSMPHNHRFNGYKRTFKIQADWKALQRVTALIPAMIKGYNGGQSTKGAPSMSTKPLPCNRFSAVERLRAASDET